MINKEDYIKRLQEHQDSYDCEVAHSRADDILCEMLVELGYKDVVDEYDKIGKWYA